MKIIACSPDRFEELVQFVVRLNSDGAHHIGFFGEDEADVRASLAECMIPLEEGFHLAYDGDTLDGVFGVDTNPEIGRAWLFGPLIGHADWQALADTLYEATVKAIPAGIDEQDLFFDTKNINIKTFAANHGFVSRSENSIMTLQRADYRKPPAVHESFSVVDFDPSFFDRFEQLHDSLFPKTYFTASQIEGKLDPHHRLFIGLENGQMQGYHFCKVTPDAHLGYVDFIGVDSMVRGRGLAADLFAAGMDWMLSFSETDKISLTVNAENAVAMKFYKNFGFDIERVMCGYRKKGLDV